MYTALSNVQERQSEKQNLRGALPDSQEHIQYTLPALVFPSELRVDEVLNISAIESFVDETENSTEYSSEFDFEDAVSHFSQQSYSQTPDDTMDHLDLTNIPIPRDHLAENLHISSVSSTVLNRPFASLRGSRKVPTDLPALKHTPSRRSHKDSNLVTWDGPGDPENPHNWPKHRRWMSTILIAMFAFIAPMASTMLAPALDTIAQDLNVQSDIEKVLMMSIFLLAFAIGPFFWGPMSEVFGRVRVMQCANLIFLLMNTVCGFAKTKQQMFAFRFLSGIGGSAPQAIGGGILSDCFRAGDRGAATAIYSLMPFLSPAVAPIMGAYLTQYVTWRWVFWATSIFDGLVQILCFFLLKETFAPAILAKKAARLRRMTGNPELHTKWQGAEHSMKKLVTKSLVRPLIMLTTQPALQAIALFRAYQYGLMYLVLATFSRVFEGAYNQSIGRASLNYLSLGVGFVIGLQISGTMQDKIYTWCETHQINPSASIFSQATWRRVYTLYDGDGHHDDKSLLPSSNPERTFTIPRKPLPRQITSRSLDHDHTKALPEYRLPLVLPFSILIPAGLFIYGWSAEYQVHWIVPNLGTFVFAIGLIVCFNCAQAYVVDTYTTYAASATGAAAFLRTMAGFSFPLFAPKMYDALGVGWGNSLLGFVSLGLGVIAPLVLWRFGGWLRSKSTYCTE